MKNVLMMASLLLATTMPAFASNQQPKTSANKESTLQVEKTEKTKEAPKAAKKHQKHSKKHSDTPKAN